MKIPEGLAILVVFLSPCRLSATKGSRAAWTGSINTGEFRLGKSDRNHRLLDKYCKGAPRHGRKIFQNRRRVERDFNPRSVPRRSPKRDRARIHRRVLEHA